MSGSTSRRKGNRAEVAVVNLLREHGYDVETSRAARGGYQSGADIVGDFPMVIEVKNQSRLDLPAWWAQAQYQANEALPVVIHKRVGKSDPAEWWVTMDVTTLLRLLSESKTVSEISET